jgi:hypothetical protein
MWLAGAHALRGDLDKARAELAEAKRLNPAIESLSRWPARQPWNVNQEYRELREKTLNFGLRRAGFPEE